MLKKALSRSAVLLALTCFVVPVGKMHADCNVVTGCDPVPPPAGGGDTPSAISITSLILYVMALT